MKPTEAFKSDFLPESQTRRYFTYVRKKYTLVQERKEVEAFQI